MKKLFNWLSSIIVAVVLLCACTPPEVTPQGLLTVTQKAATSTSITVEWDSTFKGCDNTYKIAIYNRSDNRYPHQEYLLELGENTPRAFSFPLLSPRTSYNVKVTLSNGISSELVSMSTLPAEKSVEGDIFLQNFNNLCWGYDFIHEACGVKIQQAPSSYNPSTLEDTKSKWVVTTSVTTEDELFKFTSPDMHKLLGIDGWQSEGKVYHRPGYVKLGSSSATGKLRTPKATLLPASGREVLVEFKACPFTLSEVVESKDIVVNHIGEDGSLIASNTVSIPEPESMPSWSSVSTSFDTMKNGESIEFVSTSGTPICIDDIRVYYPVQIEGDDVYGYIVDKYNKPIKGVVVSDGFSVTITNGEGYYKLTPISDTYHIFISIPSEYEVPINEYGQPCFFLRYSKDTRQYNFQLTPLSGGKEKTFALFGFGDPQVSNKTALARFLNEAVPKIKKHGDTFTIPVYGITAGDVVSVTNTSNAMSYMPKMRDGFAKKNIGFPVFQVMGNHDNVYFNSNNPIEPNEYSSTFNLAAQREFERIFGPANYSFNRGDVHIVGMRDIIYDKANDSSDYSKGFTKAQYDWLKADLSYVPKDKIVILVVHIPFTNSTGNYIKQVNQLLKEYAAAHVVSGHTHIHRNYENTSYGVYEHNIAAVCGAWWSSCICGDGTPNGYEVFIFDGNTLKNCYYIGFSNGYDTEKHQVRLYRGNGIYGGEIVGDNTNGVLGRYAFNFADNVILANVFNADSKIKVSVYEDGVYSGDMTWLNTSSQLTGLKKSDLVGSYTIADPRRAKDGFVNAHDFWAHGFQMGVLGRSIDTNASFSTCYNMFMYELKNKDAKVKVVVTDRYGNTYECSRFADEDGYKYAAKPAV